MQLILLFCPFIGLTLLVGRQEGHLHPACENLVSAISKIS